MDKNEVMGSSGLKDMSGALFANIPEGMGCMAVMGKSGDSKYMWDPNNTIEKEIAEKTFKEYRKKGYLAFKVVGKDGDRGDQINEFDPLAGRIIFVPPMAGGAGKCHCVFKHPETPEERKKIAAALDRARASADRVGIIVTLAQLAGECPAQRADAPA